MKNPNGKVIVDKETGLELRKAIWIYQGTDSNGKIPTMTDEEIEHHPDPVGWNRYVPDLTAGKLRIGAFPNINHHLQQASAVDFAKEAMRIREEAIADAKSKGYRVAYDDGDSLFFERMEEK